LKISPDGSRVTYLQGKPEDKDRLDLWEYNIREGRARILVDSKMLRRPRKNSRMRNWGAASGKDRALSGVLEYSFAHRPALLFPLAGNLYYYDLTNLQRKLW